MSTHLRRGEAAGLVAALVIAIALAVMTASVVLARAAHEQSERNQRHIDCIIGISAFGSGRITVLPDQCIPVRDRMIRDGVLPENIAPLATTVPRVKP